MELVCFVYGALCLTSLLIYMLGHSFIDAIFKRKAELIDSMVDKPER